MYNVIDLFAGAGGLSLGFEMTKKFNMVAFVEKNDNAAKTYLENHPSVKRYCDIKRLDFQDILNSVDKIDVVIGGPPCQGFSNVNRQKRKIINGNNELVKLYVDAIDKLKPNVFVMENVKTISSNKHSFYLTKKDKNHIINNLKLNIYNKDSVLYDRTEYINELFNIISIEDIESYIISNIDLKNLKIIIKKKKDICDYLNKISNYKKVKSTIEKLETRGKMPKWYLELINKVKNILENMLYNRNLSDEQIFYLNLFLDIQNLFLGIYELKSESVIFENTLDDNKIIAKMDTYIIIDYINASFEYLGYVLNGSALNSIDYGVPQNRERFVLIGAKKDFLKNKKIETPKPIVGENYVTVRDAIGDLAEYEASKGSMDYCFEKNSNNIEKDFYRKIILDSNKIYNHVCTDTRNIALKRFEYINQGNNFHSLPDELKGTYADPERTQNTIYKRLVYDKPSDTVVNVRKSMWIHPIKNRAVSAREAARLQSFPDSYKFLGTKDSVYQQIGNAVPPLLGRVVAEKILNLFNDEPNEYLRDVFEALDG
ncbi:DNA (cytosine-5-)-methyltransferase [Clostridioides difficile]|uniref:DNA cytosine methyltransferase n=1 Tax=Clostridioides difficile TaxID=1496 RepID=UPI000BB1C44E|nr:DNA cytosine methyltransferase [Clostridioides difficile]PBG22100.1 DNA (cytosine-5-)-methyltransferase [Clostridioides difficile]